jgi:hypothetical protein
MPASPRLRDDIAPVPEADLVEAVGYLRSWGIGVENKLAVVFDPADAARADRVQVGERIARLMGMCVRGFAEPPRGGLRDDLTGARGREQGAGAPARSWRSSLDSAARSADRPPDGPFDNCVYVILYLILMNVHVSKSRVAQSTLSGRRSLSRGWGSRFVERVPSVAATCRQ